MGNVPHGPQHDADDAARGPHAALTGRRIAALVLFDIAALLVVAGLVALAVWQVHRREWKLGLIARIEARVHAPPTAAPGRERWADISAAADEYRRVSLTGRWLDRRPALVRAVTELGGGFWVLAPFGRDDGTIVLVNRGFVPEDRSAPASWTALPEGPDTVTGLLRLSEPHGAFLRSNDPAADRWFSRDVAAIAASRGLEAAAPYFIDIERSPGRDGVPVPGLTVLSFSNNHLIYAITWGVLALMTAAAAVFANVEALRTRARPRRAPASPAGAAK